MPQGDVPTEMKMKVFGECEAPHKFKGSGLSWGLPASIATVFLDTRHWHHDDVSYEEERSIGMRAHSKIGIS